MVRVCFIPYPYSAWTSPANGIEQYSAQLLSQLQQRNAEVVVVRHKGTEIGPIPSPIMQASALSQIIRANADVYHATHETTPLPLLRHPLVTTVHDVIPYYVKELYGPIAHTVFRICAKLIRRSSKIIVPFEITKRLSVGIYQVNPENVIVVNYGVDHSLFFPVDRANRADSETVLYIGGIERIKGLEQLIRAFAMVHGEHRHARLLIGGRGPDEPYLIHLVKTLGLTRNVSFLGFVPANELNSLYSKADIFAWPSAIGFGLTVLEAMATGLPVVCSTAFELPELVGDAGILCDMETPRNLSDAIIMLLDDLKLRKRLSTRGIERAAQFSWARMAEETVSVYEQAAEGATDSKRV